MTFPILSRCTVSPRAPSNAADCGRALFFLKRRRRNLRKFYLHFIDRTYMVRLKPVQRRLRLRVICNFEDARSLGEAVERQGKIAAACLAE